MSASEIVQEEKMEEQAVKKSKLAKASLGYLVGNYCVRGINLISIPLFARLMSTADYGIYNTFAAYEGILTLMIGLALHSSIKNANVRFPGQLDRYTSSVILMPVLLFAGSFIGMTIFHRQIENASGLSFMTLCCLILFSYSQSLWALYQSRLAIDYDSTKYLKISACNAVANVVLSLVLILTVFRQDRAMGRIIGTTVTSVIIAEYIFVSLAKKERPVWKKEYWKYALKISLPVIPHGLAQTTLLLFDRIMINSIIGSSEAGLYSFSYNIYNMLYIGYSSLETVYSTWVFSKMQNRDNIPTIKKVAAGFVAVLAVVISIVTLIAPEIVLILGGKEYLDAIYSVYPVMLAGFFSMCYGITVVVEYYYEKTNIMAIGTCLAALINVILNAIFIPRFGYIAAAYTTLASYILYYVFHMVISYALGKFLIIDPKVLVPLVLYLVLTITVGRHYEHNFLVRAMLVLILLAALSLFVINKVGMQRLVRGIKDLFSRTNER